MLNKFVNMFTTFGRRETSKHDLAYAFAEIGIPIVAYHKFFVPTPTFLSNLSLYLEWIV
jgi:hypothetical protein